MKIVRSWRLSSKPFWWKPFSPDPPPDGLLRLPDTAPVKFEYRAVSADTISPTREFSTKASERASACISFTAAI